METARRVARLLPITLAAAGCAIAIAACGGSSPGSDAVGATTATGNASPFAMSKCMRTHGVPDFPDPAFPAGGGIAIKIANTPTGVNPQSPAFQRAASECRGFGFRVRVKPGS